MHARPVSPSRLIADLAQRIADTEADAWLRVAVDGAVAADPHALADALVEPVRVHGRPALRVSADDFLRPASLRLEFGRTDPQSYYDDWLDEMGLRREVLDPLAPGGTGRVLPSLWDAQTDRATRADYVTLPPGGVLLLSGALLLDCPVAPRRWAQALPFDLTVHLALSPAALRRRTPDELRWTLPAYARYDAEVAPADWADVVVRMDDPRHPAVLLDPPPRSAAEPE